MFVLPEQKCSVSLIIFPVSLFTLRYRLINQDRQLEIIAMQPTDAGRYRCVAKNPFGQIEVNTDVVVGGKFSALSNDTVGCGAVVNFYKRF